MSCPTPCQAGDYGLGRGVPDPSARNTTPDHSATQAHDLTLAPERHHTAGDYRSAVHFQEGHTIIPHRHTCAVGEDHDPRGPLFGHLKGRPERGIPKSLRLLVEVLVTFTDQSTTTLQALVDTGAEVSLINPKWVPAGLFFDSPKPIRLGVANSHLLLGGKRQTQLTLTFMGRDQDTGKRADLSFPLSAYDADVVSDLILSYGWLALCHALPDPRRHGVHFVGDNSTIWVEGMVAPPKNQVEVVASLPVATTPLYTSGNLHSSDMNMGEPQYIQLVTGWLQHETWEAITQRIAALHLSPAPDHPLFALPDLPGLGMLPVEDHLSNGDIEDLARAIKDSQAGVSFVRGFVDTGDPLKGPDVDELRKRILEDYALTIFAGRTTGNPPKRGDFGEAEILLKPNAVPVKQRPYPLVGDRRAAWTKLIDQLVADGKIEPGQGPWCSPSFPFPK